MTHTRDGIASREVISIILIILASATASQAQIPGLPGPAPKPASVAEAPKRAVASATGEIMVKEQVSDRTIERFLVKFLPKYPGVRKVRVAVDDGVVNLEGRIDDDDSRDDITDVVKRVEGVRLVMNQMTTDEEAMTAWEFAAQEVGDLARFVTRKWLLIVVALVVIALSLALARMFSAHSEALLAPFIRNMLLRSVVGSLVSTFLVIGGLLLALATLKLTQAVLSILGLSAVVGLAVGFAFRDITENFIASVLLGLRRPFQIGDYVTVAGQSGVVQSLNTRATVLVTLEGNHVRIPNSVIFKEIMVNTTASPTFRNSFDIVISYEASTAAAIEAIANSLRELKGILVDPPPRALVDALEPGGVRLRAYFWTPTHGVDWFQLMSDAKLKAKVALQMSGVIPPPANVSQSEPTAAPAALGGRSGEPFAAGPVDENLQRDARKTTKAAIDAGNGHHHPIEQALKQPETRVSEEGTNLLTEAKSSRSAG